MLVHGTRVTLKAWNQDDLEQAKNWVQEQEAGHVEFQFVGYHGKSL